jgi:hypothetical protein
MKTGFDLRRLEIFIVFFLICVYTVSAASNGETIRGTVTKMNVTDSTLTINTSTALVTGKIPCRGSYDLYYSRSAVIAIYDNDTEITWRSIGKLSGSKESNQEFVSEIVGDPTRMPLPLIDDYAVDFVITPDCTRYNGSTCKALFANTTIKKSDVIVKQDILFPRSDNQNFSQEKKSTMFFQNDPDSVIYVLFVDGETSNNECTGMESDGPQTIQNFAIQVNPPSHALMYQRPSGDLIPLLSIMVIIGLLLSGFACLFYFRNRKKHMNNLTEQLQKIN